MRRKENILRMIFADEERFGYTLKHRTSGLLEIRVFLGNSLESWAHF